MPPGSAAKTIARNTAFLLLSEVVSKALSLILVIAMARFLGDSEFGKFSFAVAFMGIFLIFTDFGVSTLIIRDVAKDKAMARAYLNNALGIKLALGLAAFAAAMTAIVLMGAQQDVMLVVLLSGIYLMINELTQPFRSVFNAFERLEFHSIMAIVERIVALGLGLWLLFKGYGLVPFVSVFIFSYFVSLVMAMAIAWSGFVRFRPEFDFRFWKILLRKSLPFWVTSVFMLLYHRIDTVMLSLMKTFDVVGWYNAAFRITDALNFIPFIMVGVVFPAMSRLHASSRENLGLLYTKAAYYLFMIGLPIAVGITLLADRIILFVYSEQFLSAAAVLRILIWAELFVFMNFLAGYLLNAIDKPKLFTFSTGVTVIINIVLNYVLILKFSMVGAAIATAITHGLNFVLLSYFASRNNYAINWPKTIWKPALASLVMAGVIYAMLGIHLFITIPAAGAAYLAVIVLLKGLTKQELEVIKGIRNR